MVSNNKCNCVITNDYTGIYNYTDQRLQYITIKVQVYSTDRHIYSGVCLLFLNNGDVKSQLKVSIFIYMCVYEKFPW